MNRPNLYKLVNFKLGLELRLILKAGSTFLERMVTCMQPGAWQQVHQSVKMPANHTALIVVRDPVDRFASALYEVMRRIFTGQCPEGACGEERDNFFTDSRGPSNSTSADTVAEQSSWYRHALKFYQGKVAPSDRGAAVRDLLAAAVTDAACSVGYYASEHFMSQTSLMVQGTDLSLGSPEERAVYYPLEKIGTTPSQLANSNFFAAIGAADTPIEKIEHCLADSIQPNHDSDLESNSPHGHPGVAATGLLSARQRVSNPVLQPQGLDLALLDGATHLGFSKALPNEEELLSILHKEPAVLLSLCVTYAKDAFCLAHEYDLPEPCASFFKQTAGELR